jgi:hypothetical protein
LEAFEAALPPPFAHLRLTSSLALPCPFAVELSATQLQVGHAGWDDSQGGLHGQHGAAWQIRGCLGACMHKTSSRRFIFPGELVLGSATGLHTGLPCRRQTLGLPRGVARPLALMSDVAAATASLLAATAGAAGAACVLLLLRSHVSRAYCTCCGCCVAPAPAVLVLLRLCPSCCCCCTPAPAAPAAPARCGVVMALRALLFCCCVGACLLLPPPLLVLSLCGCAVVTVGCDGWVRVFRIYTVALLCRLCVLRCCCWP